MFEAPGGGRCGACQCSDARRTILRAGLSATALGLLAACQSAGAPAAGARAVSVTLATATPGGGFPVYGAAFANTIAQLDPGLTVVARNTRGSTENIPLIEAGAVDLALVTGEPLYEAVYGIGRPAADLRILSAMYSTPGMFVVPANSAARTIADLVGKPVAFGARSSGLVILARYVLAGLGRDMDRDFKVVLLERAGDGPAMLADGRVAALWGGGSGWPGFAAVAASAGGARFIAPDATQVAQIVARQPLLKPMTIPAGSYPGQTQPIASVGSWAFVIARPSLPDDTAYRLARALHRGESALAARLPQASETRAVNTVASAPRPDLIHPGVRRYLADIGLMGGAPASR